MNYGRWCLILTFVAVGITRLFSPAFAERIDDLQKQINELQAKIAQSQSQKRTLAAEIEKINNEISLTRLQIAAAQERLTRLTGEIRNVSTRIGRLEESLSHVSTILVHRVVQAYKQIREDQLLFLLVADNFAEFLQRLEYLRLVQKHDGELLIQIATTRKNYHDQKEILEDKKVQAEALAAQLRSYKAQLDQQNQQKQALLEVTKADEKRYQEFLTEAQRELEAIRASQFVGKREVKKGEVIGLMGNTGFSTGAHLHFGVYNLAEGQADSFSYVENTNNPLDFLQNRTLRVDGGACYDKSGNAGVGSGSWDWPLSNPTISQCFGTTPFSFVYLSGRHDGLDVYDNNDPAVRAVDDGSAHFYRGNSAFGNNVRLFHSNGKMTLYLHLQ